MASKASWKTVAGLGLLVCALAAGPALADPPGERGNPGQGGGHGKGQEKSAPRDAQGGMDRGPGRDDGRGAPKEKHSKGRDFRLSDNQQATVMRYEREHRYRCPHGLVETRNGCLPRGQAKKRYVVGQRLPAGVVIEVLPRALLVELPPPPVGYIYRRVDGDVLLIAEGTREVINALVLFSAVGR